MPRSIISSAYAGQQIENSAYVHWALRKPRKRVMQLLRRAHKSRSPEWTSLAARDSAVRDGTYKRLLDAAGSTLPREPVVVTLKAIQHDTLASILRTPVPEFAATRMKNVAERTEARQTLDELLAGAHERGRHRCPVGLTVGGQPVHQHHRPRVVGARCAVRIVHPRQ